MVAGDSLTTSPVLFPHRLGADLIALRRKTHQELRFPRGEVYLYVGIPTRMIAGQELGSFKKREWQK